MAIFILAWAFDALTLRSETDLARMRYRLPAVVDETMRPASVSLWLRDSQRREPKSREAL